MTHCNPTSSKFSPLKGRQIETQFSGGDMTSDTGVLLLREMDKQLGLSQQVASVFPDTRHSSYVKHSLLSLLRQRLYALCQGYEDLNDHEILRHDKALQLATEAEQVLGSQSTLCRLEKSFTAEANASIHHVLLEQFIASFDREPSELILDFDATDDQIHGEQEGRFYNGYYRNYCFLPLYVFCGEQLLVSYLRASNIDGAKHSWAILSLLVKRLRKQWPKVRIILRGDGGFCRHKMMNWCERHDVKYVLGIGKNSRLLDLVQPWIDAVTEQHNKNGKALRWFTHVSYAAQSWSRQRRVIAKIEHTGKGMNPRFVVTNLDGEHRAIYEQIYCARGEMENHIKEQQLDLFADRTSCHDWWPNQWRLLLSSLAYVLMERFRHHCLRETAFANLQVGTIRLKLLKIAAVIITNTRRIRLLLPSAFPYQGIFEMAVARLKPG